ncbi:MAG: PKD domain-containing protein, partial [Betaproteobacteria bacterium]|nr:PKD domain-containing protein [Betaproteobacteria bacterium]
MLTATPTAPLAGKAVAFSATSTDPAGLALSYQWDFGDGSAASGATASHTYASGGSYTVRVTATNSASVAATATTALKVLFPPTAPTVSASLASVYTGQVVTFTGASTDPNGGAVTYLWDFGDGSTLGGASVAHSYAAAGSYTVTLTASNAAGGTASGTLAQAVVSNAANTLVADCAGSGCAAASPNNYAGTGTGTWRYSNTTGSAATVNLSIGGVTAGKTVTLLFSNGETTAAATKPGTGVLASPALAAEPGLAPTGAAAAQDRFAAAHDRMLQQQQKWAAWLHQVAPQPAAAPEPARLLAKVSASPAVGTSRVWND